MVGLGLALRAPERQGSTGLAPLAMACDGETGQRWPGSAGSGKRVLGVQGLGSRGVAWIGQTWLGPARSGSPAVDMLWIGGLCEGKPRVVRQHWPG
jgi:hypothetical protein